MNNSNLTAPEQQSLYDPGMERAVLACVMKHPELVDEMMVTITHDDFHHPNNRYIAKMIVKIAEKARTDGVQPCLDIPNLLSTARAYGVEAQFKDAAGGMQYLSNVGLSPADPKAFTIYLNKLLDVSKRVSVYSKAIEVARLTADGSLPVDEMSAEAERLITDVCRSRTSSVMAPLSDSLDVCLKQYEMNAAGENVMGVSVSTLPTLMRIMNKIRRRQMAIIFARPKTGKSALMLNIAINVASQKIPVLYLDTEMSDEEQTSRSLSMMSGVREWDIMSGDYLSESEKFESVKKVADSLRDTPLIYSAARGCSTSEIVARIREFKIRHVGEEEICGQMRTKPCLVMYDWLKVADKDSLKHVQEHQELGYIATALKDAVSSLDIPIICGAQANRAGNDVGVGLKSAAHAQAFLASSDRLLQFCTCLIWLRRLNQEETDIVSMLPPQRKFNQMLHVIDQRGGPTCLEGICLNYHGETLTYEERPYVNIDEMSKKLTEMTKEIEVGEREDMFD